MFLVLSGMPHTATDLLLVLVLILLLVVLVLHLVPLGAPLFISSPLARRCAPPPRRRHVSLWDPVHEQDVLVHHRRVRQLPRRLAAAVAARARARGRGRGRGRGRARARARARALALAPARAAGGAPIALARAVAVSVPPVAVTIPPVPSAAAVAAAAAPPALSVPAAVPRRVASPLSGATVAGMERDDGVAVLASVRSAPCGVGGVPCGVGGVAGGKRAAPRRGEAGRRCRRRGEGKRAAPRRGVGGVAGGLFAGRRGRR